MSSKMMLFLLLASCLVALSSGRSLATDDDQENSLDRAESAPSSSSYAVPEEWVKVSKGPQPLIKHELGSKLELECEVVGSPPPRVKWIRGAVPINFEFDDLESNIVSESVSESLARVRSRLILDHTPTVGEKVYSCVGRSGGKIAHATTTVVTIATDVFPSDSQSMNHHNPSGHKVQNFSPDLLNHLLMGSLHSGPVAPRITQYYSALLDETGATVVLPCQAVGRPRPEIYWMDAKDNIVTGQDPRIKVLPSGELMIANLKWEDMGEYTCVAKNAVAKDAASSFVYPVVKQD